MNEKVNPESEQDEMIQATVEACLILTGMSDIEFEKYLNRNNSLPREFEEAIEKHLAQSKPIRLADWKNKLAEWKAEAGATNKSAFVERPVGPKVLLEKVAKGVLTLLAFAELPSLEGAMATSAIVLSNQPKEKGRITGPDRRVLDLARLCDEGDLKAKVPWAPKELTVTRVPVPGKPNEPAKVRYVVTVEKPGEKGSGVLRVVLAAGNDRDEVTLTPKIPNRVFTKMTLPPETAVAFGIILEKGGEKR